MGWQSASPPLLSMKASQSANASHSSPAGWFAGMPNIWHSPGHLRAGFPPNHWKSADGGELGCSGDGAARAHLKQAAISVLLPRKQPAGFCRGVQEGHGAAGIQGMDVFVGAGSETTAGTGGKCPKESESPLFFPFLILLPG